MQILLIDDDRDSLENLGTLLEKRGFAVLRFTDPQKALEAARSQGFQLVVTDYEMPRLDGLDVLKRVREINPAVPVIIMSACPDYNLDQSLPEAGPDCTFLSKPLDLKLFMSTLSKIRDTLQEAEDRGDKQ